MICGCGREDWQQDCAVSGRACILSPMLGMHAACCSRHLRAGQGRAGQGRAGQGRAVQCSAVQCSAVQCSAVQCSAVQLHVITASYLPTTCVQAYAVCVEYLAAVVPGGPIRVDLTVRSGGVTVMDQTVTFPNTTLVGGRLLEVVPAAGRGVACNAGSRGYLGSYTYTGRNGSASGGSSGGVSGSGGSGAGAVPAGSHDLAPPELEIVVAWSLAGGEGRERCGWAGWVHGLELEARYR